MSHLRTMLLLLLAAMLPGLWVVAADAPQNVAGGYTVMARGYLSGSGQAAVGAQAVSVNIKVTDPAGNEGMLVANGLKLVNNRFQGTGHALGLEVTILGRVDPAGSNLRAARIVCTYSAGNGKSGRIVGERRGK